ncbi:MAG TPA: efflux RND transporter permease subunit [Terriglobia bacterium]|nr:efflux RND transporter permease subunit [Terriglobia bacterium]
MKIADVSIRRPVFALMMSVALVTLGIFSYGSLGVDLMPRTEQPNVNVRVQLPGASAEEIETTLTLPIETAVNSIEGIDELRANSNQGNTNVNVNFILEKDMNVAVQDVRDKIGPIVNQFGRDASAPVIQKSDPDSGAILTVAIYGDRDFKELSEIVDEQIKQVLETTSGVAEIEFSGERRRQIQILLNADRLYAYGVTVDQVRNAIQRQNVEIPGGTFISGPSQIALRTLGRLSNVPDFNRIILSQRNGSVVTLGDVARVVDTVREPNSIARVDGKNSVALSVRKQTGTNSVAVVQAVLARLETIKETLPKDLNVAIRQNQATFIERSIDDIQHHLIYGSLLASLVVLFFLRNLRTTIIAALAIPVSLIGTFIVMNIFGLTLNNMTLLALSLATGIVIDDAIVVLENIFRYVEEKGVSPRQAASEATAEIGLAVLATTLSLVVIFLPVVFITGQIGQYLLAFGIASATAILISMFVSFTLTPALCAMWLRPQDAGGNGHQSKKAGIYARVETLYTHMLGWSLRHRFVMLIVATAVSASAVLLLPRIGTELVPEDDQSEFNVSINLPRGTTLDRTAEYVKDIEPMLLATKHVQTVFTNIQPNQGNYLVGLVPIEEREVSQQDMIREVRSKLQKKYPNPGTRINVSGGTALSGASTASGGNNWGGGGGNSGNRLQMLVQGPDMDELQKYMTTFMEKLREIPGVVDVGTNFEVSQPELRVTVDRVRAADLGVPIDSLAANLRTLVGGEEVTTIKQGDNQYNVQLRLDEQFRDEPSKLGNLLIPAASAAIRVSDVAQLTMGNGPSNIQRFNRQRQITVYASLDGMPLGEGVTRVREKVSELNLKPGYAVVFTGNARTLATASNDFAVAMLLAVAFIYMVLASQFNSLVHPLTIMTALPLSLPAGLLALLAFGMTLNVYSAIGMLMLFGIVKKNSILQVDYTNTLRAEGMERHEALMVANKVRLRPILMTTISIVAGMMPIALGRGAGAGSRASMAVTIIGGQMLCLLLTLLITPVAYSYFDDLAEFRFSRLFNRVRRGHAPEPAGE